MTESPSDAHNWTIIDTIMLALGVAASGIALGATAIALLITLTLGPHAALGLSGLGAASGIVSMTILRTVNP